MDSHPATAPNSPASEISPDRTNCMLDRCRAPRRPAVAPMKIPAMSAPPMNPTSPTRTASQNPHVARGPQGPSPDGADRANTAGDGPGWGGTRSGRGGRAAASVGPGGTDPAPPGPNASGPVPRGP